MKFFFIIFSLLFFHLALSAQQLSASHTGLGLVLNVDVDLETDIATITLIGPEARWFAYGFGGNAMAGTYAIIVEEDGEGGKVSERKLGNHFEGTELTSSFLSEVTSVADGVKTVVVTLSADAVGDYYNFPESIDTISFIAATGFGESLAFHGGDNYAQGLQSTATGLAFSAVVPVTWGDFKVSEKDGNSRIAWVTSSEENNSGFYVQRSLDTKEWESLDFVNGKSEGGAAYEYIDNESLPGVNYYRIKQVDEDGHVLFSGIKSIELRGNEEPSEVVLFPNPVHDILNLEMEEISGVKRIQVLDMNYKILVDEIWSSELSSHKLNVSSFPSGHYLISIKHKSWAVTKHFVKQ